MSKSILNDNTVSFSAIGRPPGAILDPVSEIPAQEAAPVVRWEYAVGQYIRVEEIVLKRSRV